MKKVLSVLMALLLVFGSFSFAEANNNLNQREKIDWLVSQEILAGRKINSDGSADLALDENVTRAEITKLLVYVLGKQSLADSLYGTVSPFNDVSRTHWANGYITVATSQRDDIANGRRIIIGYPNGNFYPEQNVNYAELSAMLVRIVKRDLTKSMENNSVWPDSYMNWAAQEGIFKGMVISPANRSASRRDAFEMIYNAMYELGLIKEEEKSDVTSLRGISIYNYPGIVNPRDNSTYNIELPSHIRPSDVRASDIRILTTDENAVFSTPIPSENGRVWRFEVIAANKITTKSYTLTLNGGINVNNDVSIRDLTVRGVRAVVSPSNKMIYNVELPRGVEARYLTNRDFNIVPTNPDAKVTNVYTTDNGATFNFSVVASNGRDRGDYVVYTGGRYYEPRAGADLVINVGGSVTRDDAKRAIDPRSYNINDVEAFYWETPPRLDLVRNDVPAKVRVLFKDGNYKIVDVKVDVVGNERVYDFEVTKSSRFPSGYSITPRRNNPDNNLSLNIDRFSGNQNPTLRINNNLNTRYVLSSVNMSTMSNRYINMTRPTNDTITLTNMLEGDFVTLRIIYKVK